MKALGLRCLVAALLVGGCGEAGSSNGDPRDGTALYTGTGEYGVGAKRAPHQESINKSAAFYNRSQRRLILRRINPTVAKGSDRYGRIIRVLVKGPGTGGWYGTIPLVRMNDKGTRCDVQRLRPVNGYRVGPGERVDVAVWIKPLRVGKFKAGPLEIVYEQDGIQYSQTAAFWIDVTIKKNWPRTLPESIGECAHRAKVLPGNKVN